ncbi:Hypothetical protein PHPALM_3100 [Phytophthora palmivora]|uniref:Transmembrane protein n=1 Tax=Phytophthora palmivora TaxID=4796 RepID=A0A2P4YN85_9STRA|nr:Hypothetical protein PHPALM_3100 [Phytophthora palmivora]
MDRVVKMKNRLKISHLGKYSSERANNLDKYCQQTSLIRVLLTCVLLPWPALLLVLVMECIPLHDPADGLKSNYGVVIRLFIVLFCAAAGSLFQIRATTPQLFYWKIAVISIGTGVCAVIILVVVANLWIFPLPFCLFMTGIPAAAFFVVLFLVLVQPQNSITSLLQENAMWQKIVLISTQTIIALVYVTFGICFSMSTSKQRIGLLVFQPFMKLGLKHLAAQQVNNNPECIPVVVVFTIDVFNGLYSSIFHGPLLL